MNNGEIKLSAEVERALHAGTPVVALESTIIAHGMPYPQNLQCALEVEAIVYENGATPATVAVIDGVPCVGLDREDLEKLATLPPEQVRKCSRRDLPVSIALGECAATTVASTMILAKQANVQVFVTGGIGGVHRGAYDGEDPSLDVSADLVELGQTNMAVVCAGVKSILDIGRTLEFLETQGVTVVTYGQDKFPAFLTASSDWDSPIRLDDTQEIASVIHASNNVVGLQSGSLIAVPNPEPLDQAVHDEALAQVLQEAADAKITGKALTPFLLKRLNEVTQGSSLEANVALVKNNARIGAEIAVKLNSLRRKAISMPSRKHEASGRVQHLLVVGGAAIDIHAFPREGPFFHTSNPGKIREEFGGVGRNIAECIANLEQARYTSDPSGDVLHTGLMTAIGQDNRGRSILEHCAECDIDTSMVQAFSEDATSTYCSIADASGDLLVSIADMDVFDHLSSFQPDAQFDKYDFFVIDANMPPGLIERLCERAELRQIPVLFETVSMTKGTRAIPVLNKLTIITPNRDEVTALAEEIAGDKRYAGGSIQEDARLVAQSMHTPGGPPKFVLVTLGEDGLLEVRCDPDGEVHEVTHPARHVAIDMIKSSNGAGDTFAGSLAWSLLARQSTKRGIRAELEENMAFHISFAMDAASLALQTPMAVPEDFSSLPLST
ncbi:Pseudouridine-metabolizing bifunctional protein C1861.05 [Hondaea fermentalgiana]|uniref:Pseudouridine-metabolizing bifunctional protein C1861.05 n=1 Tax=Hondaea fermentalgiana TaxID=2315210 RepID=A0A2R5G672_9STRA|nr:Pseudouridine-metabolizing bifunctional protein C1861.05 [Hondaea fermentalgiana]|eukprot:GBG26490.1 Pseudouridine-metabolizing bifunctional protein C1861.05 [Hondaea fermentalgiana]